MKMNEFSWTHHRMEVEKQIFNPKSGKTEKSRVTAKICLPEVASVTTEVPEVATVTIRNS